jgi:hypothetical protein
VTFRLRSPATVVFAVHGPSPSCGVAGTTTVHGRRGINRVRLTGRFDGRPLAPGTYRIDVIARRHGRAKRIGTVSVQVVPPRRLQRSAGPAPVFYCVPPSPTLPAALPGVGLSAPPANAAGSSSRRPAGHASVRRSGGLSVPGIAYDTGNSVWDLVLDLISYAGLALLGTVLLIRTIRYVMDH